MTKILVVDDDINLLKSIQKILELNEYLVETQSNPTQVLHIIKEDIYDCVLLDVKMPGINGLDLLKQIIISHPKIPVIMISGQSNIDTAVQAIKEGAYDFIEKPIEVDRLLVAIKNAIQNKNLKIEKEVLSEEIKASNLMIGISKEMKEIFTTFKR